MDSVCLSLPSVVARTANLTKHPQRCLVQCPAHKMRRKVYACLTNGAARKVAFNKMRREGCACLRKTMLHSLPVHDRSPE
eukprot:scaffold48450_cov23-Tisochrysis_lutea.AAC.2